MRRNLLFFLAFTLFTMNVLSQNKIIDSLKNELKTHIQKDTVRVKILNHLAFYHYRNDPPQAIKYAEQAGELADEIKSKKGKARSIYMKGIVYLEQAKFEVSISNFNKAIELYKAIDDLSGMAGCYNAMGVLYNYQGNQRLALEHYEKALEIDQKLGIQKNIPNYLYNIGNIYLDSGKFQEALENFKKALEIFIKNGNEHGMLNCWNSIAIIYKEQANYPKAIEYHNKSLDVAKKSKDSIGVFQSLNNIGNLYQDQKRYDKALDFYNEALDIQLINFNTKNITAIKSNMATIYIQKGEFSIAISYLEEVIKISREIQDERQLAISLNNLGVVYLELKNYQKALDSYKESNKTSKTNQLQYDLVQSYIGIGKVYYNQKKYDSALTNILESAKLARNFNYVKHQRDAHELLSNIYSQLGQYQKALNNHQRFKILNDSIFNKKSIEKIAQLENEYKYKQALDSASIRELKLTKRVKMTSQNLEKSQRNLLLGVITFLIMTLILGAIIFSLKFRNVKAKTQNIIIEQKLLRSQMTPHFIFNSLSVLQGMILNKEEKQSISYLSRFSKLLRTILENSRHKTVVLSEELSAIDSYMTLQNLDVDPPYEYSLTVATGIDQTTLRVPPMLIQPFVENAIEHAFPNKKDNKAINVALTFKCKKLVCTIEDNGIGFDPDKPNAKKEKQSLATTITSERLEILSKEFNAEGSVNIENKASFNKQGTLITLVIPYKIVSI